MTKLKYDFCSYQTVHKSALTTHGNCSLLHDGNAKVLECNVCKFTTVYKSCIVQHKKSHL